MATIPLMKSALQVATPLVRARSLLSDAPGCPAGPGAIESARSLRPASAQSIQPVDLIRLLDGTRFILKSGCEASEVRATCLAARLKVAPPTWEVGPNAFLQELMPQASLAGQWRAKCSAEKIGEAVARVLRTLHTAGLCYIDSMSRHLFWDPQSGWRLIDYGTALILGDPNGPCSEVEQWLHESPQSRSKAVGASGTLEFMAKLHDWLGWRAELLHARRPLMWPCERRKCIAAIEAHYPRPSNPTP